MDERLKRQLDFILENKKKKLKNVEYDTQTLYELIYSTKL